MNELTDDPMIINKWMIECLTDLPNMILDSRVNERNERRNLITLLGTKKRRISIHRARKRGKTSEKRLKKRK